MNNYEITYEDNKERKQIRIYAKNEAEAGKAFKQKYPHILSNAIRKIVNLDTQGGGDYHIAIFIANLMSLLGWLGLITGGFLFFTGAFFALGGVPTVIGIISSSLMLIMGSQITKATVNNANYSKQMLHEMRRNSLREK